MDHSLVTLQAVVLVPGLGVWGLGVPGTQQGQEQEERSSTRGRNRPKSQKRDGHQGWGGQSQEGEAVVGDELSSTPYC